MKKIAPNKYEISVAGYDRYDRMYFMPIPWKCGHIEDGVALKHAGQKGYWILSFTDLVEMVELARKERE